MEDRHESMQQTGMAKRHYAMFDPMGIIMLATMDGMYRNKSVNVVLYASLAVLFFAAFAATRTQAFIHDRQFVASMIPHHSGAFLMCREARLTDPGVDQALRRDRSRPA